MIVKTVECRMIPTTLSRRRVTVGGRLLRELVIRITHNDGGNKLILFLDVCTGSLKQIELILDEPSVARTAESNRIESNRIGIGHYLSQCNK